MSAEKKTIVATPDGPEAALPVARITGCSFYPGMRAMINIFDLANRNYTVDECDVHTLLGMKDYKLNNATQQIPYVTIKDQVIMADTNSLIKYICIYYSMDKLYPQNTHQKKVDQIMEVVALQFRVTTDRLMKFAIMERAIELDKMGPRTDKLREQIQQEKEIELVVLNQAILPEVENWLGETDSAFLVNEDITAADVVLFHEIVQLTKVTGVELSQSDFPKTVDWMSTIRSELVEIDMLLLKMNQKMDKLLVYNIEQGQPSARSGKSGKA